MNEKNNSKVCIVSISLAGGGAERSAAMLSQMLHDVGHDVYIVILNDAVDYDYKGRLYNLGALKTGKDTAIKRVQRFKKLRNYLANGNFDLIIDHRSKNDYKKELFYHNYIYRGIPKMYVIHSSNRKLYFTKRFQRFAGIYDKNVATIAVSNYIKTEVAEPLGVNNCQVIHNAFDPSWSEHDVPLPLQLKDKKYILAYGRIVNVVKDFKFLIDSFTISECWKNDHHLVIMGNGPDEAMLKGYAQAKESAAFIHFIPFQQHPFSIIKKAQMVTLTSQFEGFPMVLVESLSLGTPVVSLDIVSGPNEIVEDEVNGLLVQKRDLSLFAGALQRITNDIQLYNRCKKNAATSVVRFSMENIALQWQKIIKNELHKS